MVKLLKLFSQKQHKLSFFHIFHKRHDYRLPLYSIFTKTSILASQLAMQPFQKSKSDLAINTHTQGYSAKVNTLRLVSVATRSLEEVYTPFLTYPSLLFNPNPNPSILGWLLGMKYMPFVEL